MGNIRYTINADMTLEKWYLEKELHDGITALRKTPTPKFNCCMRLFPSKDVYKSAKEAKLERMRRSFHA